MNQYHSIYLPQFTIGDDAFGTFPERIGRGRKAAVICGKQAWEASKDYVLPSLERAEIIVTGAVVYGKDATWENVKLLEREPAVQEADVILAVGGGKCIDTVKVVGDRLSKPVYTIPSIASNCAPITQISILYHEDGSFREILKLKNVPVHCFINPKLTLAAPVRYLWAGIGDAMAKHVESAWSAKSGEALDYGSALGITAGSMCFYPMLEKAEKAMEDAAKGVISRELEETILNIIISPGIVSVSAHPDYNGGIAHALFYGMTSRKCIEERHLHGEVVAYGMLVNLMVDHDWEKLSRAWRLSKAIKLPVCLGDLELDSTDPLEDVLKVTMENQELKHTPYPVTKEMIREAITALETYQA